MIGRHAMIGQLQVGFACWTRNLIFFSMLKSDWKTTHAVMKLLLHLLTDLWP
jgi:hypothetical protein